MRLRSLSQQEAGKEILVKPHRRHRHSKTRRDKLSELPLGVFASGYKYRTHIQLDGRSVQLGTFETAEEASLVYELARQIADRETR